MKKWIQKTGTLIFLAGTAAGIHAAASTDLETLFYTYAQDNMVFDYDTQEYIYSSWEINNHVYNGILALEQCDLNTDGTDELLAIRIKGGSSQDNGSLESKNDVIAEVYQYQGDRLQRIAQYTMAERVLRYNANRVDVFLVNGVAGPVLCCEKSETSSLIASGQEWQFTAVSFDGAQFAEVSSAVIEGSGWSEEEESQAWNALNAVGLYPSDIISVGVADQVGNEKMLNSIRRYMITDYDTVNQFLASGTESAMQFGETDFHSYVNEGIQNKVNGVFCAEAAETVEEPVQNTEYVIPESNSRYITEEDLVNLTEYEILLARNEIYARHGYIFNNTELDTYFRNRSWYVPGVSGDDFTEEYAAQVFNEYEMVNIGVIVQYENMHGMNQF